jgi:hypothetical protein
VTHTFPSGIEGESYTDTEETNGVLEWDRLGEEYNRDIAQIRNYRDEEEMGEATDVPRPEMILDRFAASSPIPFSETGDENVPITNTTITDSWGFPAGNSRQYTRRPITPTLGLNFRSPSDGNNQPHRHESFYQQQVLGAWEREREVEELDRARNVDSDERNVSVLGARWGLDPDGESEVWGVVDAGQSWAIDYDSESADKSAEGVLFPGR